MITPPAPGPIAFQRAMVFIDGTNLFYRLRAERLKIIGNLIENLLKPLVFSPRQLVRAYLYTSQPHLDEARKRHDQVAFDNLRIVLGDAVLDGKGNYKEKGVDALLVADMIYHAAMKNYDSMFLISTDTDFVHAIERVEDFGCRTSVTSICAPLPERLKSAADIPRELMRDQLIQSGVAVSAEN